MAIASILHRISGIVLFLLFPFMLYLLSLSLNNPQSFAHVKILLEGPWYKLMLWAFTAALLYHFLAGVRHIIMDFGFGESVCAGRRSAVIVIALTVILTILLGIWIW